MALKLPEGFAAAGGRAMIKPSEKPDLALLTVDVPAAWALVATRNRVTAACVDRNRELSAGGGHIRALAVNSGNANCATGELGIVDNQMFAESAAATAGVEPEEVLTASTGVVGRVLPLDKIKVALPPVARALDHDVDAFAQAILTTDLVSKVEGVSIDNGARIVGVAKGSGMIHPDMATMLAFVTTDAKVPQAALRRLWPGVIDQTFNQVTVDGDTSPNDMAIVLSSGRVAVEEDTFVEGLTAVCRELAKSVARDGEGATKLLTVRVTGAASESEARTAARSVAASPLVKAAVHGCDPNWGRILIALGYSGVEMEVAKVHISLQNHLVFARTPQPFDEGALSREMDAADVVIDIDLAVGDRAGVAWGCDLTREYVAINADYTT